MKLVEAVGRVVRSTPKLREPLRRATTTFSMHRPGVRRDIAILSTRRAGSTWLMHVLAATPGVRSVNEPDLPELVRSLPTALDGLLEPHFRKLLDVPVGADDRFRAHFFDPRITRIRGPYDPRSPSFHLFTDRRVLKLVHATAIADWFAHQGFQPVYLIRHPVASALSMARSGITLRAEANLRHPGFRARFLDEEHVELGWSILRSGSPLERFVLEWCLDNLGPLRAWSEDPDRWTVLSYEELMLSGTQLVPFLGRRLDLREPHRMLQVLGTPSPSTNAGSREALKRMAPADVVGRWRRDVDEQTQAQLFRIVERFGIDAYRPGSPMPSKRFLNLEETPG